MIHVRRAAMLDFPAMAALLNTIIHAGGTTALEQEVTAADLQSYAQNGRRSVWHVAENDTGEILGFQWIEARDTLPAEAADIATFVKVGQTGLGVGSALFEQTKTAARALGFTWINANIRADNEGGLIYYQSRGFEDYDVIKDVTLGSGLVVTKRLKRYDLT